MSEDLIKRSDAIRAFNKATKRVFSDKHLGETIVGQISSADRWIPCSERLPNEDGFYLVTITDGEQIAVCKMPFVEFEWKDNWFDDEVIAWMPLPSAYQREGDRR